MDEPEHLASTRAVYDFSASQYAAAVGTTVNTAFERPLDRAVLDAFCEDLRAGGHTSTLDIGCGVGRVTSYVHERGVDVSGVDLSPQMIAVARTAHPQLSFEVAAMTELPIESGSLDAAVLWYSIIHTPSSQLHQVWGELSRVLVHDGTVLLAFQAGDGELVRREHAYGSSATITWYRHRVDDVVRGVEAAGFSLRARIWRAPELEHETTPQAFLVLQRQG